VTKAPAIVHLIGYPGAGKYTTARYLSQLAALDGRRFVVVDNHHTSNVIFAVLAVDGVRSIAPKVWERVGEVREAVYRTIEEMSPPEWSFIFTNVLRHGDPVDESIVQRVELIAARRRSPYIPVHVLCEREEILRRVPNADRSARMKWIDSEAVSAYMEQNELVRLEGHAPFQVDVTTGTPDDAARRILAYIDSLDP
jgi:hypothetical protein